MQEILHRNTKGQCAISLPEPAPAKQHVILEWDYPVWTSEHHATGYILSRCGVWSVCKVKAGDATLYEAWKRSTVRNSAQLLDFKSSPDEAKAVCEAHANV